MPEPIEPSYRDRAARAYRHLAPRPAAFNPIVEQLYLNAAAPRPTTSAAGAILQGLLSGYVGTKLGQSKMDYAESERRRQVDEIRAEKDRERQAAFADQVGLLGVKSALETGTKLLDPSEVETPPQIRDRVSGVLNLIPKVPQLTEAMRTDPSLASRMVEDAARDPATGVLGVRPKATYKDRTVNLPNGTQQFQVSLDGGRTWQAEGGPAPRWESQAGGGGDGVKLDVQKFVEEMSSDFFTTTVVDQQGNTFKTIPPEFRKIHQELAARTINLMGDPEHPVRNAPEALRLAVEEFDTRGLIPAKPTDRPLDPGVLHGAPGPSQPGWFSPRGAVSFVDAQVGTVPGLGPRNASAADRSPTPPAPATPQPHGLGLSGLLGGPPTVQKDAQGWYLPMGGRGGKQYISEDEAATYRKLSLGFGAPQHDAKGWFINKGRGRKEYIPESVARDLLIVLPDVGR